jgi:sulfatase maturation enzyme AslB (radical SAM superfamily)
MADKNLKELAKFFNNWKIINYNNKDDFVKNWKHLNTNLASLSEVNFPFTNLIQDYRNKGTGLPLDSMQLIFDDLRKKLVKKTKFSKVQDNLSLLANFHNYKNMMADYASKSEDHAHHAQKMHNSLQLLNHAWRDNMIE